MLVVAAAIVRDGRVLAAQRSYPAELAGQWEFPGGKVEPDEMPRAALVREIGEELGMRVDVHERLAELPVLNGPPSGDLAAGGPLCADSASGDLPSSDPSSAGPSSAGPATGHGGAWRLRLYRCTLAIASEQPAVRDHHAVRWVDAEQLAALPWLITNRQLLPHVFRVLGASH